MDIDTARPIVIALLCVLAIAVAAATLNSAVTTGGDGTGFGYGSGGTGFSESDRSSSNQTVAPTAAAPIDLPCYPVLMTAPAILAILGGFLLLVAIAYWRAGLLGSIAIVGPVGIPVLLIHALLTACAVSPLQRPNGSFLGGANRSDFSFPPGGSGGPGDGATTLTSPSVVLFVVLGIALVGALVLLVKSSSGDEPETQTGDTPPDEEDVAAIGRMAGEAADRIESAESVENEVYRAWREMTQHLDVSAPESSTPGEFAVAAVDAGIAREDVTELTNLFEEVRYGGEDATGEREERAVSALRRIERTYAEDGE